MRRTCYAELRKIQRQVRNEFDSDLGTRVHRSISWIHRAEASQDDPDAGFIFYWIAFNAIYAGDWYEPRSAEKLDMSQFFSSIVSLDQDSSLYRAIWVEFQGPVKHIFSNKFVFGPFWRYQSGCIDRTDWRRQFRRELEQVRYAMQTRRTEIVLKRLFDRLYVLRNQLVHGSATWGSSANRSQVEAGFGILGTFVPMFVMLILENPGKQWGGAHFPFIQE